MLKGNFQTDGTGRLRDPDGILPALSVVIIKGKDEFGGGGGGSPIMQLGASYGRMLVRNWNDSVVLETFYPVLAMEVIGHGFRCIYIPSCMLLYTLISCLPLQRLLKVSNAHQCAC